MSKNYYGDRSSVPIDIQEAIGQQKSIRYWSRPNPLQLSLTNLFCSQFGFLVALPCFWIHLCLCSPFFCFFSYQLQQNALATEFALTDDTVDIIVHEHDLCCCPYVYRKGQEIQTIPLSRIVDVRIDNKDKGCCACTSYSHMYIDNIGRKHPLHGHENMSEARTIILDARDHCQGGGILGGLTSLLQPVNLPVRSMLGGFGGFGGSLLQPVHPIGFGSNFGGVGSLPQSVSGAPQGTTDMLIELGKLKDMGLITEMEYQEKRQNFIATL